MELKLGALEVPDYRTLRLTYVGAIPLAADPTGAHDALNPSNYRLAGPGAARPDSVSTVDGVPRAFDVRLSAKLVTGTWTLQVGDVRTSAGLALSGETTGSVTVTVSPTFEAVNAGSVQDGPEAVLRQHLSPAYRGRFWDAWVAALGAGDALVRQAARSAFDQLFLVSASGQYLVRRAADIGVQHPADVGISDEQFRRLAVDVSSKKVVTQGLLEALEVYYGSAAVRAGADTAAAPFALQDGDDLQVLVDERDLLALSFSAADFSNISAATATEVAVALTRAARQQGSSAYAAAATDPETGAQVVRLLSGSLGAGSSIRVTGGRAQNRLQFPEVLDTTAGAPGVEVGHHWTVSLPAPGIARYKLTGAGPTDLSLVRPGDYANVFGSAVESQDRGSFPILAVDSRYVRGHVIQEIANEPTLVLWRLDEAAPTFDAVDTVGHYNLSQTASPTVAFGQVGGARGFAGTQYFSGAGDAPAASTLLAEWTVEAWVRQESAAAMPILAYAGTSAGSSTRNFLAGVSLTAGGLLRSYWEHGTNDATGSDVTAGGGAVSLNTWTHVAVRKKSVGGGNYDVSFFKNGVLASTSAAVPNASSGSASQWWLGKDAYNATFAVGKLDEVWVSKNARSDADILADYNAGVAGVLTQSFDVANPSAIALTEDTEVLDVLAASDILFFRPRRLTPGGDGVLPASVTQSARDQVRVQLPATSSAVRRGARRATYLQVPGSTSPSAATQGATGLLTLDFGAPHGFLVGDQLLLDGWTPAATKPAENAGDTNTLNASPISLWAQTRAMDSLEGLRRGATALLATGDAFLCGGQVSAGTVSKKAMRFRVTATNTLSDGSVQYDYEWVATASMSETREDHTATPLVDSIQGGKVLVAGGWNGGTPDGNTEIYDPSGNSWSAGPAMVADQRFMHSATLLANSNKVLLAGGNRNNAASISTSELYDPSANAFSAGPAMRETRSRHRAVRLSDGRVLVVGGTSYTSTPDTDTGGTQLSSCELYDGSSWAYTGRMGSARTLHQLVLLPGDFVVAIGGYGYPTSKPGSPQYLSSCEVWDSRTGRWSPIPAMGRARARFSALLTSGGKVLVAGGEQAAPYCTELLDPATLRWSVSPARMPTGSRSYGQVVEMSAGGPIIWMGGGDVSGATAASGSAFTFVEVPASETFSRGEDDAPGVVTATPTSQRAVVRVGRTGGYSRPSSASDVLVTTCRAPSGAFPGPFLLDRSGVAVTGTSGTTAQDLLAGQQYGTLRLGAGQAAGFPDEPGYLVLAFGSAGQVGPVPYLGRLDQDSLVLEFSFRFPTTVPSGSVVTLLDGRGAYVPADPTQIGAPYLTASGSGRVAAQQAVEDMVAAGLSTEVVVQYPGDRGLGGESLLTSGAQKLSDAVSVWAGDDQDAEVQAARDE